MPGVKTNEREGTQGRPSSHPDLAQQGTPGPRPRSAARTWDRAAEILLPSVTARRPPIIGKVLSLGRGQCHPQRRIERRGAVRLRLLRRRGQARSSAGGPGPGVGPPGSASAPVMSPIIVSRLPEERLGPPPGQAQAADRAHQRSRRVGRVPSPVSSWGSGRVEPWAPTAGGETSSIRGTPDRGSTTKKVIEDYRR